MLLRSSCAQSLFVLAILTAACSGQGAHTGPAAQTSPPGDDFTPSPPVQTDSEGVDEISEGEAGAHRVLSYWYTSGDKCVVRTTNGDFRACPDPAQGGVRAAGDVILRAQDVHLVFSEPEQGVLETIPEEKERLSFAFQLLVPEDRGEEPLPLVVYLHHGWDVFRGTDNDERIVREESLLSGENGLTQAAHSRQFPAVILVPQLIKKETISAVENEWAAFTALDNARGTVTFAAEPSRSARYVYRAMKELREGKFVAAGEVIRIDRARTYVVGHSMGGLGVWDFLSRWPDVFAAGIVMAGYPDFTRAAVLRDTPIWAFHHEKDCYNTIKGTETMIALLHREQATNGTGTRAKFTRLGFSTDGKCDQAHFQTPSYTWQEPGVLAWLFAQRKTTLAPGKPAAGP